MISVTVPTNRISTAEPHILMAERKYTLKRAGTDIIRTGKPDRHIDDLPLASVPVQSIVLDQGLPGLE